MIAVTSENSRLAQLQSWIAAGWQIEEPVLLRSAYYGIRGRVCAFEVVVNCQGERRVVALHDVPEVQAFLSQHDLSILDVA